MFSTSSTTYAAAKFPCCRCLSAVSADTTQHRFVLGTGGAREQNEVQVLDFDEESNRLGCVGRVAHAGEVFALAPSPADAATFASCGRGPDASVWALDAAEFGEGGADDALSDGEGPGVLGRDQPALRRAVSNASDDGGWADGAASADGALAHLGAGCDVDVVLDADLTAAAFRDRYVRNARPVLVRGAALSWPARSAARRDALLRRFGAAAVAAAAVPYAALFGEAEATVALGDFAAGLARGGAARLAAFLANASADAAAPPAYVFGNGGAAEALVAALLPPPEGLPAWLGAYGEAFALAAPQFYLGPPLSGAPAPGQDKRAKFQTSKPHISAVFHSFWLIFGRAIISRNGLEAWMFFLERARAEHSR